MNCSIFAFPWYYNINPFVTEEQGLGAAWQTETVVQTEKRVNELEVKIEARLEKKYQDFVESLNVYEESDYKFKLLW